MHIILWSICAFFCSTTIATAEEFTLFGPNDICRLTPSNANGSTSIRPPGYGLYGYRHSDLHEFGTIQELMSRTGKSCCDGGVGGECRVTTIKMENGAGFFLHGDIWCPLNPSTSYAFVKMPLDAPAVVCASKTSPDVCPTTYCAGMAGDG
jgi:hypothetical protein